MKLQDIIPSLTQHDVSLSNQDIANIHLFPQYVKEGDLFISLTSSTPEIEKIKIDRAIANGAKIIIKRKGFPYDFPGHVRAIEVDDPRHTVSEAAAHLAPSQPPIIAGITGTSGKTSTALFANQIWLNMGLQSAYMGSLGVIPPGGEKIKLPMASPASGKTLILHYYLDELAKRGITHVASEMTSAALEQCRADHVHFSAAAFTNLSFEHLNYHKTMEAYFMAKAKLFAHLLPPGSLAVINHDDAYAAELIQICKQRRHHVIQFGLTGGDIHLQTIKSFENGSTLELNLFGQEHRVILPVPGSFQALNLLAALGITIGLGGDISQAIASIPSLKPVVGRWEKIGCLANGASIYMDFAHKPAALQAVLKEARSLVGKDNTVTVVFGCDGNADPQKRPMMGAIAARFADRVIITDDNVRNEDPATIRAQIREHCSFAQEIPERTQAIEEAIAHLKSGDICVIIARLDNYDPAYQKVRPLFGSEERSIIQDMIKKYGS